MKFLNNDKVRFVLVGGINTAATYLLYLLLLQITTYTVAYTISYVLGIGLSYVLVTKFVFRQTMRASTAATYPLVYVVQYVFGIVLMYVLVDLFNIPAQYALLLVIVISLPVTYTLSRLIVNKK